MRDFFFLAGSELDVNCGKDKMVSNRLFGQTSKWRLKGRMMDNESACAEQRPGEERSILSAHALQLPCALFWSSWFPARMRGNDNCRIPIFILYNIYNAWLNAIRYCSFHMEYFNILTFVCVACIDRQFYLRTNSFISPSFNIFDTLVHCNSLINGHTSTSSKLKMCL